MSKADSTAPAHPSKPYPSYPLHAHASGQWAAKIRGKRYYFGVWADPDAALAKYMEQKDALHAGRTPRPDPEALTVKEAANAFLNHKQAAVKNGELSPRTFEYYRRAADEAVSAFGKARLVADLGPDDFAALRAKLAKRLGAAGLGTTIQCIRCLFKHAGDNDLIDRPVRYGAGFRKPSKKTLRLRRAEAGPKLFAAEEVHRLLAAATVHQRAMILLGVNAGFGNSDCGNLPLSALDLERGWINFPRPKTGLPRRCPLWPETAAALRESLAKRPEPKGAAAAGLFFITRCGDGWAKDTAENPLSDLTAKLLRRLGMNRTKRLGFYTLRHTFRTVADEAKDQPAADFIMGHEVPHMSTVYRETISDVRLRAVSDHVRQWLFSLK